ncbi:hypothetical protein ACI65C_005297 [Semiaphis heraclei]
MSSGIESLLIERQKAKKAMYISDLDDDDDVKPNKIKKLKSSAIECPIFSENFIDPDKMSETVAYFPERDNKNGKYRQTTSYVKAVFDKSPVKINYGWSPSPLKAAAKDQLRSASKEQISYKEIDSCTKEVISTTGINIVNFNMLSDEETFDTSVIKNKVSPDSKCIRIIASNKNYFLFFLFSFKKIGTPLQITSSGSQIFSHSGVENSTQKMLKSLLRNMVYLQTDIKHISMIQIEILSKLDCTTNNIKDSINKTCSSNNEFLADDLNWPINDMQYLEVIEEKINDKNIRNYLVNDLSNLGGNSVRSIIKRILYKLFTDNLLSNFSMTGKKGKQKFCKLNLCSVIFDAVKNQKKGKHVDQNEMEERIKYHLAQAPFSVKRFNNKISENQ